MSDLARVEFESRGRACVVRVDGEIDLSNAREVAEAIERAMPADATDLVVDLSHTSYLDSSGIGLLVRLAERLRARRRRLKLVVPADSPLRVTLELTGIPKLMPLETDLDEALPGEWGVASPEAGPPPRDRRGAR